MSENGVQLQILSRLANLPIVSSAIDYASGGYARLKSCNGLVSTTLLRAEQSLASLTSTVVSTAKPVISRLERPISIADHMVCQGFDKLQDKVPAIKKSPEEIKDETVKLYEGSVGRLGEMTRYGNETIVGIKDYGVNKVYVLLDSTYAKAFLRSVDTAIDLTENAVDHYLPPAPNEPTDETKSDKTLVRMGLLSDKMRRRMYDQVLSKWLPFIFVTVNNVKATLLIWVNHSPNSNQ